MARVPKTKTVESKDIVAGSEGANRERKIKTNREKTLGFNHTEKEESMVRTMTRRRDATPMRGRQCVDSTHEAATNGKCGHGRAWSKLCLRDQWS